MLLSLHQREKVAMAQHVPAMTNAPAMYVKVGAAVRIMALLAIQAPIAAAIKAVVVMASVRTDTVAPGKLRLLQVSRLICAVLAAPAAKPLSPLVSEKLMKGNSSVAQSV